MKNCSTRNYGKFFAEIFNCLFCYRCVSFIMARLILKELMDASIFLKFKSFLTKVYL